MSLLGILTHDLKETIWGGMDMSAQLLRDRTEGDGGTPSCG